MFPNQADKSTINSPVDLSNAYALSKRYGKNIRIYPGSMEVKDGKNYALKSRAIGVLGIGGSIEEARQISQEGANAITGGGLWNRTDVASKQHIAKSIQHMENLRHKV